MNIKNANNKIFTPTETTLMVATIIISTFIVAIIFALYFNDHQAKVLAVILAIVGILMGYVVCLQIRQTRRFAEQAAELVEVNEQMRKLAKIPNENPNPILRVDRDGLILYANHASQSLLNCWQSQEGGYLPDDLRQRLTDIVHSSVEIETICNERIFQLTFMPIEEMDYLNVYGRDITERKRIRLELYQLNAELEERVKQRTAELEAANNELKDFAYIVSHDLKAPLRGISQLANWLVKDYASAFDEEGKQMVALLINRVTRMDNLINGILQYSRVGRLKGRDEPVNLEILIKQIIDSLSPPTSIEIIIEPALPTVIGDKTQLEELFQNLLSNAIKFMDKPQGHITVGCIDEGTYWKFMVADNGPGIEEKYHQKIFQIFQTLTPRDVRESTGIGLSLVKKIVESYHGRVWLESTVGQGTTFFFTWLK